MRITNKCRLLSLSDASFSVRNLQDEKGGRKQKTFVRYRTRDRLLLLRNSLWGLWHFDDGQRVGSPERFGRNRLSRGPAFDGGRDGTVRTVFVTAVHRQIVGRHAHGHDMLGQGPDHLLELVDLVAQVPDAGVALVQPALQPDDVLVFFPRLGHALGQLALQVP